MEHSRQELWLTILYTCGLYNIVRVDFNLKNSLHSKSLIKKKKLIIFVQSWYASFHLQLRFKNEKWASLVVQWLRIRLPMQGTGVWALVQEDPTCRGATKPVRHNYWACALQPTSHNYWAHVPQLLKPVCLEPVLHNKRRHLNEKAAHHNKE